MRVATYIAERLAKEGIDKVFVVQGAANNDLLYAIADTPGIDYVCAQHEQCCGFAAEAFAKVTGRPGCAIATSGPGGQNLVTAIANCFYDSVPVLFITGQVSSRFMRRSSAMRQLGFQEWPAVECLRPITKHAQLVTDSRAVPQALELALAATQYGRSGPVLLDLPIDVQKAELDEPIVVESPDPITRLLPLGDFQHHIEEQTAQLVIDLAKAERPVLLIGGGVRGRSAESALDILAEALQIPVFPTWNALDVVTSDWPWYCGRIGTYGGPGRNFALQNSDLLIAIGCRISGRITGGRPETFARGAKKYVVDIDSGLLDPANQEVKADVNIWCDASAFLSGLERQWRNVYAEGKAPPPQRWAPWYELARGWMFQYDPVRPEHFVQSDVHFYAFARRLSEAAPANAIIVYDCGGNAVVMNHAFQTKRGQRYFSNNGNSPMGFALSAAIGAWFAAPERPVICVIGDGGLQINIQELQTIAHYGAKVKVFVLNNHCYGITKAFQDTHYSGRYEACGPKGYSVPDFWHIVRAYRIACGRIDRRWMERNNSDLAAGIQVVLDIPGPYICLVEAPDFHSYVPAIRGWGTPIEDMSPQLPREEFRANMIIEPLPGWEDGKYS